MDKLDRLNDDLKSVMSGLKNERLGDRKIALTTTRLNRLAFELAKIEEDVLEKIQESASRALQGVDIPEGDSLKTIAELKHQITECRRLIKQGGSPPEKPGIFGWVAGWFSSGAESAHEVDEDFQEIALNEPRIREIVEGQKEDFKLNLENQSLQFLPDEFGYWEEVVSKTSMSLANNQIEELPESILGVTGLQDLDVSHNLLTELPGFIGNLSQLRELFINDNPIENFPEGIYQMKQLEELDLRGTKITNVVIRFFPKLKKIYVNKDLQPLLHANIAKQPSGLLKISEER